MSTSFTYNPTSGPLPLSVNFNGVTTIQDPRYSWDFGDGNTDSGINPTNIYTATGVYEAVLTASGLSISGIYLTTYISDDFDSGQADSGWDPSYTGININDCDGNYATDGNTDYAIVGSGANITGRFDFQYDFTMGCTNGGNTSLHFYFRDATDTNLFDALWNGDLDFEGDPTNISDDGYVAGRRYTTRITRGIELDISGAPTYESTDVIRCYFYDNWSGGATNNWIEYSTSPISGAGNATSGYIVINNATYNGFDNFVLQADAGLPYETSLQGITETASGTITVGSGYTISGSVYGVGDLDSTVNEYIGFSGAAVYGWGYISSSQQFIFTPTPSPPSGSANALKSIKTVLTNKNRYPYKIPSDIIVSKIDIFDKGKISYRNNVPVELYFNYSGSWTAYESGYTNRFGSIYLEHSTSGIPQINNCLGIAKATIDGKEYVSNLMRYNFVRGAPYFLTFIIDAGHGPEAGGDLTYSTYVFDDFGDISGTASFSSFWDPTWTGIYGITIRDGNYVARDARGSTDSFVDILPTGTNLSGDFSIEARMLHGSGWSFTGGYGAIALFTSEDTVASPSYQLGWITQIPGDAGSGRFRLLYRDPPGGAFAPAVYSQDYLWESGKAFKIKFERTGDTLLSYYDYGSGSYSQLGSGLTLSGTINIENIQTYSSTQYGEVSPAFDELTFQADYGLPSSGYLDRSNYDIFTSDGRTTYFDRMWPQFGLK